MQLLNLATGTASRPRLKERFIYIACPWTPVGGGMYKVADYLIQSQTVDSPLGSARLRPLDTRGGDSPLFSLWVLLTALLKIAKGRFDGGLAGVHVNVGERMSLFRKGTLIAVCSALGVPTVLHLHAQMDRFYGRLPNPLRRLTRWVFSLSQIVIVIGPVARSFVTDVLQVPAQRVRKIINGVPKPAETWKREHKSDGQRILFLANLSDRKGLSDLLQALARPELENLCFEVTVAGGGDVAGYEAKARELGVNGFVRFEGWCDQNKVSSLLANCEVMILPSHDEVLPLSILEALAHGVAVVTTAVGEIPALLTDGVNALFVTVGEPASIAAGLQRILTEPELTQSLASNGLALYLERFCLSSFFLNVASVHRHCFGIAGHYEALAPQAEAFLVSTNIAGETTPGNRPYRSPLSALSSKSKKFRKHISFEKRAAHR